MKTFLQFVQEQSTAVPGINAPVPASKTTPTTVTPQAMVNQAKGTSTAETAAKAAEQAAKNAEAVASQDEKARLQRLRTTMRTTQAQIGSLQKNLQGLFQAAGLTTGTGSQQFTPQGTGM